MDSSALNGFLLENWRCGFQAHIGFYGCCLYNLVAFFFFFLEIPALLVDVRKLVSINNATNKDVVDRPTKDVDDPDAESDGPGETSLSTPCRPSQVSIY